MRLITNKSKNLLYRIVDARNAIVQFSTSYAVVTQRTADTNTDIQYKCQYRKGYIYLRDVFSSDIISSTGKITRTFTTPADLDYNTIIFGLNGSTIDTLVAFNIKLKPSTTYTFTCNFTNITQGSISWKDMMLVEGSTVGEYEPYSYNLLNKWQYHATQTVNGVTFTNNGDGSLTVNGTATKKTAFKFFSYQTKLSKGDKICLSNPIDLESYGKLWYEISVQYTDGSYIYLTDVYLNTLLLANDVSMIDGFIVVGAGETVSGALLKPAIYDLTLMYGAGKEPTTVDQFYADHPELKVSPLGFIGLKNLEISNKNIKRLRYKTADGVLDLGIIPSNSGYILNKYNNLSEELLEENIEKDTVNYHIPNKTNILSTQTLNGINGVNDYIEVIDKGNGLYDLKKTQNIDSVDLGTLDWLVDGPNFYSDSISSVIKPPANNNSVGNYVCQKYVNCALIKSFVDGDFATNSSGYVYFRNSAYTTVTAFKTAMNGVILYYQLKTPVTTIATNLTYNQVSAIRTNGGLLLVNDNNNQKYAQPNVTITENFQYKI